MGLLQQEDQRCEGQEEQGQQVHRRWRWVRVETCRYLKAKDDEIKAKQKVLESINTGLKESVTKVNPKKLAKLPYNTEPILKEVFSTFYHILYNEPAQSFDWPTFVKLALLHE